MSSGAGQEEHTFRYFEKYWTPIQTQVAFLDPQELYHFTCDCIACNQSEEEEELEEKEWERRREIEREEEMKEAELFLETFHLDLME